MATEPQRVRYGTFKEIFQASVNKRLVHETAVTYVQLDILYGDLHRLVFGSFKGDVALFALRHLAKKYKMVCANPPDQTAARRAYSTLQILRADPNSSAIEIASQVEKLDFELEKLPAAWRAQYKRHREYVDYPVNSAYDRKETEKYHAWTMRPEALPLLIPYATERDHWAIRRKIANGEVKMPEVGQYDHENTERQGPDLALARLNGLV